MRKIGAVALAWVAAIMAVPSRPVAACGYGGLSNPVARFATADCVLVGKVCAIEEKSVSALLPGATGQRGIYNVAIIKVEEMLKGDTRLTHVRLGLPNQQTLRPGYEACFFLTEHPEEPFFLQGVDLYDFPIYKQQNARFTAEVERFRRLGKLLRDPVASLKSANAEDRLLTAAMFISRWRTFRPAIHAAPAKTTPVDGLSSRLVLKALAEVDWTKAPAGFRVSAWRSFNELGLTAKDGWNPPPLRNMNEIQWACKLWLKANADDFRISTFVLR
jgi:hypothetical protein